MSDIIDLTAAKEIVGPIIWNDLRLLVLLCLRVEPEHGFTLELVLRTEGPGAYELQLVCNGVRNLRFEDLDDPRMTGFDVVPIGDRQWESISWEVADFEENKLRFYCASVTVESARRL